MLVLNVYNENEKCTRCSESPVIFIIIDERVENVCRKCAKSILESKENASNNL